MNNHREVFVMARVAREDIPSTLDLIADQALLCIVTYHSHAHFQGPILVSENRVMVGGEKASASFPVDKVRSIVVDQDGVYHVIVY